MLENKNKIAFTLVELIVTITIVAILGTIAFISFGKNIQGAKNVKVHSDLVNLSKKITILYTRGKTFDQIIKNDTNVYSRNSLDTTISKVNSGHLLNEAHSIYNVGNINFIVLGEKRTNFLDLKDRDYVFAYVSNNQFVKFELAGVIYNLAGVPTVLIEGNYYKKGTGDVLSLVSASGSTEAVYNNQINVDLY